MWSAPDGSMLWASLSREVLVMGRTNLAGRAGRWSASHWKTAAFGWIAFAVAAVVVGSAVGVSQMKSWAIANGDSRRAEQILDQGNFKIPARESVLVQSATGTVDQQSRVLGSGRQRGAGALRSSQTWPESSPRSSIRTPA